MLGSVRAKPALILRVQPVISLRLRRSESQNYSLSIGFPEPWSSSHGQLADPPVSRQPVTVNGTATLAVHPSKVVDCSRAYVDFPSSTSPAGTTLVKRRDYPVAGPRLPVELIGKLAERVQAGAAAAFASLRPGIERERRRPGDMVRQRKAILSEFGVLREAVTRSPRAAMSLSTVKRARR